MWWPTEKLRAAPFVNLCASGPKEETFKVRSREQDARALSLHARSFAPTPRPPTRTPTLPPLLCLQSQVTVDIGIPLAVVDDLEAAAERVVAAEPTEFTGDVGAELRESATSLKFQLVVYWVYTHSGVDEGREGRARTKMYAALAGEGCSGWSRPAARGLAASAPARVCPSHPHLVFRAEQLIKHGISPSWPPPSASGDPASSHAAGTAGAPKRD